jgi:hypothetical protein
MKLVEEFGKLVPDNLSFNVGYFEGQQHTKIWLASKEDFNTMYLKYPRGNINLWCDGRGDGEEEGCKKKRKRDVGTRRQEMEDEVDNVSEQLKEKHGEKYDLPMVRLWAKSVCNGVHDDLDNPPDLPPFNNYLTPKKPRRNSLNEALTGAAVAISNAFKPGPGSENPGSTQSHIPSVGVSPSKTIELRMKNYEQLRYLQQLLDDGILSTSEFEKQKGKILSSLDKLN